MKRNSKECDRRDRSHSWQWKRGRNYHYDALLVSQREPSQENDARLLIFHKNMFPTHPLHFSSAFQLGLLFPPTSSSPLHLPSNTLLTSARSPPPPRRTHWPSRIFEISLKLKCCSVLPGAWPPGTENKSASVSVCSEKLCFQSRPVASHTQYVCAIRRVPLISLSRENCVVCVSNELCTSAVCLCCL